MLGAIVPVALFADQGKVVGNGIGFELAGYQLFVTGAGSGG